MITRKFGRVLTAFALVTGMLMLGTGASAFGPVSQNEAYEIHLDSYDFMTYEGFDRASGEAIAENSMVARYGGRWQVHAWNAFSATPRHLYGNSVPMVSSLQSADAVESLARQVIDANADVLKASNADLRLDATPHALGKWVAHFQQTYQGVDVEGAQVRVAFSDDGKLMLLGSDYFTDIALDATPGLNEATAKAIASDALPYNPTTDSVESGVELLVLPVPVAANRVEHHLVWRVRVHTSDPHGIWVTDVDAHDGEILQRLNDIHFAFEGGTENDAQVYGLCDGVGTIPAPYLDLSVSGAGSTTTDENGDWYVAGGGGSGTVTAGLSGPYVSVSNFNGSNASFSGTATADVPFTLYWDDSNARQDERDTFDATNDIHDFFDQFDPSFSYSNAHINAYVNRDDGYCPGNAWWDGTINFCAAGGSYNNTGELQQVVHHEFGHGVQAAILGSQGSQGLGEGNGDILGNLITQDPIIGRGFYSGNCVSGIRNSDNNLQYPGDVVGQEIHYAGQVIAGFNWDAMVAFQDLLGGGASWDAPGTVKSAELWHFGRVLMHPSTQPDQVFATFFADDDNGDLGDGTPNHTLLCDAATNHGFDCPEILVGVFIYHDNIPYSPDTASGYEVTGTAVSLGGGVIVPASAELFYRVNGGAYSSMAMSETGNPDEYTATIPAQGFGSVVEYYLQADNDLGASGTSPVNAPTDLHYFQVNDEFADEMEYDTAWSLSGIVGENTASTGNWERDDPEGTTNSGVVQPEDDHTAAGTDCWVTGASSGGSAGGNDVDGGVTTLYSPRFDLEGASDVSISYWRYYTNNMGNAPNADWWTVQITNDDGASWTNVEYTQASTNTWENVVFDLADYFAAPGVVQLRFIAADENDGSLVEALVDDFILMGTFDLTPVDDDGMSVAFVTNLQQNSPNPFNPKTEIRFSLEEAGHASLKVYDASGRLVSTLADDTMTAGPQVVTWDGMDDAGQRVASGVYFYRLETATNVISKRMVLLK